MANQRGSFVGIIAASCIGAAAASAVSGQPRQIVSEQVVRAERFELVDGSGAVRAHLGTDPQTGITNLTLFDGNRNARVWVGASAEPSVILWDAAGHPRASLHLSSDGAPALEMRDGVGADAKGDPLRVALGAARKSLPRGAVQMYPIASLTLFDSAGNVVASLPTSSR